MIAPSRPSTRPLKAVFIVSTCPWRLTVRAFRPILLRVSEDILDILRHRAQVSFLGGRVDVVGRLHRVMGDDGRRRLAMHRAERSEDLEVAGLAARHRQIVHLAKGNSIRYCGAWTTMG